MGKRSLIDVATQINLRIPEAGTYTTSQDPEWVPKSQVEKEWRRHVRNAANVYGDILDKGFI